jgi:malate synthase
MSLDGLVVKGEQRAGYNTILTPEALTFLAHLHRTFNGTRKDLLSIREQRQREYDSGLLPSFLPTPQNPVPTTPWHVAPHPADLQTRYVEITGPASNKKMVINALNSGADCYMADFEDSDVPTWNNLLQGQINMYEAVRKTLSLQTAEKTYALHEKTATLLIRPRGWHLPEAHIEVDGEVMSGSLFDFGLFFFHNARERLSRGTAPYFYLPKMESNEEARLWNDVFTFAQDYLKVPQGSVRATVLIETLPAAFRMEEILYELKDHISGLNCGRWDYIFSCIKTLGMHEPFIFPDRKELTMDKPFLKAYADQLIHTCHKHGAYAMGGMAAYIPSKDPAVNTVAFEKVKADKMREVLAGHDGTWVAHPGLVQQARDIFSLQMHQRPNQIDAILKDVRLSRDDLLLVPKGERTKEEFTRNIRVGIEYISSWLKGVGCVPIDNLMEDAATAEISRAQVWQYLKHGVLLDGKERANTELYLEILDKLPSIDSKAAGLFTSLVMQEKCPSFLTLPAYASITGG